MLKLKKKVNQFPTPYTCMREIKEGGIETKLSMILMGFGNFVHKQRIKGLLYLTLEVVYIVFMAVNGIAFSQHARFTWQCTAKRSMGCDKTGVSVYKRGLVGIAIVVWSSDGFSDTTDDLGMERSA